MKVMDIILRLSPIGVFCLILPVVAENGPQILGNLGLVRCAPISGTSSTPSSSTLPR